MHAKQFKFISTFLGKVDTRRGLGRVLALVPFGGLLADSLDEEGAAARRRSVRRRRDQVHAAKKKKKKKKKQKNRQNKKQNKKKTCVPSGCPANACGNLSDGCGGTLNCGCAANQLCVAGVCHPCTVTCLSGDPVACGAALQTAMAAGGTVYVCPGNYRPGTSDGFLPALTGLTLIGAGDGASPDGNTILDAHGAGRVLLIENGTGQVTLERLRLTGGYTEDLPGGGIFHGGTTLRMTECTVSGNTCVDELGGGIYVKVSGTLEMTRCTVRDNHAMGTLGNGGGIFTGGPTTTLTDCLIEENDAGDGAGGLWFAGGMTTMSGTTRVRRNKAFGGGGIVVNAGGTLIIAETCRVTANKATAAQGGGIANADSTVILQGVAPSPIVVNNCHENCTGTTVPGCSTDPPDDPGLCPP